MLVEYAVGNPADDSTVVTLLTTTDASGYSPSVLVTAVDAATGNAVQPTPWNITSAGALSGCNNTAASGASGLAVSSDGGVALVSASFGAYTACLVALEVATGAVLWSAPVVQAPPWTPLADPGDASRAYVFSGSATVSALRLADGSVLWTATLPRNESAIVGVAVVSGSLFVAASFAVNGCPLSLTRVYAINVASGQIGASASIRHYPDVGAGGAIVAAADAAGGAMVYVRGTNTRTAAEGLDSFIVVLAFNGSAFHETFASRGSATGTGVAGVAAACRRSDVGYVPLGTLAVGPRDGQVLVADAVGIQLFGQQPVGG